MKGWSHQVYFPGIKKLVRSDSLWGNSEKMETNGTNDSESRE
jgi:hypothetical protein